MPQNPTPDDTMEGAPGFEIGHWNFYRSVGGINRFCAYRFYNKDLYSVHAKLIMIIADDHKSKEVDS